MCGSSQGASPTNPNHPKGPFWSLSPEVVRSVMGEGRAYKIRER